MILMTRTILITLLTSLFLVACGDFPKLTIDTNASNMKLTNDIIDIDITDQKEIKAIIKSFNKAAPITADLDMREHDYTISLQYDDAADEILYLWLPEDGKKAIIVKSTDTASGYTLSNKTKKKIQTYIKQ